MTAAEIQEAYELGQILGYELGQILGYEQEPPAFYDDPTLKVAHQRGYSKGRNERRHHDERPRQLEDAS